MKQMNMKKWALVAAMLAGSASQVFCPPKPKQSGDSHARIVRFEQEASAVVGYDAEGNEVTRVDYLESTSQVPADFKGVAVRSCEDGGDDIEDLGKKASTPCKHTHRDCWTACPSGKARAEFDRFPSPEMVSASIESPLSTRVDALRELAGMRELLSRYYYDVPADTFGDGLAEGLKKAYSPGRSATASSRRSPSVQKTSLCFDLIGAGIRALFEQVLAGRSITFGDLQGALEQRGEYLLNLKQQMGNAFYGVDIKEGQVGVNRTFVLVETLVDLLMQTIDLSLYSDQKTVDGMVTLIDVTLQLQEEEYEKSVLARELRTASFAL